MNNHSRIRDLSAFRVAAKIRDKNEHERVIAEYNLNPKYCLQCGKPILAKLDNRLTEVRVKKFCSQHCAAAYNNARRSPEAIEKQRKSLVATLKNRGFVTRSRVSGKPKIIKLIPEKTCPTCGKVFKPNKSKQVYCSRECAHPLPTRNELASWVHSFVKDHGYIPTSKISRKHHTAARHHFGSWNKMMTELGYTPYMQKYGKKAYKSKDGHISDSLAEVLIDNWLFEHGVAHERRKKYPNSKRNCDFYLVDYGVWMEYFGLAGEIEEYDEAIEEKRLLAKENDLPLVEIFADDLFPNFNLEAKVKGILNR